MKTAARKYAGVDRLFPNNDASTIKFPAVLIEVDFTVTGNQLGVNLGNLTVDSNQPDHESLALT